ncbi:MAG TPA: hypothetical protein VM368_07375, partial [Flavisolibacter sp.]|nr:hypothetical protein [Flavisolibacter sp.]
MKKIILAFIAFATVNTAYSQTEEQLRSLDSTRKFLATTDFIYPYIDTPPGYIGGTEKWQNYQRTSPVLKDAIRKAKEQRIPAGKYSINIRFSVNPDG